METQRSELIFDDVVAKLCRSWDVLRHAVDANFGGIQSREKSEWLENVIVDFFKNNSDLHSSEVEHFISEIMDNEFDLLIEDDSLRNLSKNLCQCYEWLSKGDSIRLDEFLSKIKPPSSAPMQIVSNNENGESGTDDDDDGRGGGDQQMEIDLSPIQNKIEPVTTKNEINLHKNQSEDGWTVVSNRKKR